MPAVDSQNGKEVEINDMVFTSGFNSRPEPFEVDFVTRSEELVEAVKREFAEKDVDVMLTRANEAQGRSARAMKRRKDEGSQC